MSNIELFREETRTWLAENCPASVRSRQSQTVTADGQEPQYDQAKVWQQLLVGKGWTYARWPKEYGGGGLSQEEFRVLADEMVRIGVTPPTGGSMIGLTLLDYGTEEQKKRHLPRIVSGEVRWCQGFSEPGAGSDLASLSMRAEDKGDHFLVNGQKIWTSGADRADWIFTLVRTEPQAPKHDGISFLLIDMDQPGVTVKPIKLISGTSRFCETFFDDAVAKKEDLIGGLNHGWTVGKRLLQHERAGLSGLNSGGRGTARGAAGRTLERIAREYIGVDESGKLSDRILRDEILTNRMNARAYSLTQRRAAAENASGETETFATSIFKFYNSKINRLERHELLLKAIGTQSLGWEGDAFTSEEKAVRLAWLESKSSSIAGGTSEIQLNIIAKRVLGLPD